MTWRFESQVSCRRRLALGIVTAFAWMMQEFAMVMHAPTLESVSLLLSGWILAHHRTVTLSVSQGTKEPPPRKNILTHHTAADTMNRDQNAGACLIASRKRKHELSATGRD